LARISTVNRRWRHGKDGEDSIMAENVKNYCNLSVEITKETLDSQEYVPISRAYLRIDELGKHVKSKKYTAAEKEQFKKALSEAKRILKLAEAKQQSEQNNKTAKEQKKIEADKWQNASKRYATGLSAPNHKKSDDTMDLRTGESMRRVQSSVSLMLNKIAEDNTGFPYEGDEFWDIDRLMQRSYTKAQLKHCKFDRDKESVAFLVDTSPSCRDMAETYSRLVSSVLDRGDVTLVRAPNARPMQYYDRGSKDWHYYSHTASRDDEEDVELWKDLFRGRKVIFFGDTDGEYIVSAASRFCDVYWFYNESYEDIDSYTDNHSSYQQFEGKIYLCNDVTDFLYCVSQVK